MEDDAYFDRLGLMETLCSTIITQPLILLHKRLHEFVTTHAPVNHIPDNVTYYVLHNGHQFFDRSGANRMKAFTEIPVDLQEDAITTFQQMLTSIEVFAVDNPILEHTIRKLLRKCSTPSEATAVMPRCTHKFMEYYIKKPLPEEIPSAEADIIKQRIVQLMVLFPNL